MLLKLLIIGAIFYGLYRLVGGRLLPEKKRESASSKGGQTPTEVEDELVECAKCSTYVVKKEAILFKGTYYCSPECLPSKR
jgi:uncharacterized protein